MKTSTRGNRQEDRLNNAQGKEINAVFNKLVEEFNPIIATEMFPNPSTGVIDFTPKFEEELVRFDKRWRVWAKQYQKNKRVVLNIKLSGFLDYVAKFLKKIEAQVLEDWKKSLIDTVGKNLRKHKKPITYKPESYRGQKYEEAAYTVLVEFYWTDFHFNPILVSKNWIRSKFKKAPSYPVMVY